MMFDLIYESCIMRISHRWPRNYRFYLQLYVDCSKCQTVSYVLNGRISYCRHIYTYTKVENANILQTFSNLKIHSIMYVMLNFSHSFEIDLRNAKLTQNDFVFNRFFKITKMKCDIKQTFLFENHPT